MNYRKPPRYASVPERQARMAYEKYFKFVPFSERAKDGGPHGEAVPIPRVQINFNAHAYLKRKITEAAKGQDMTLNEWLCNAVIEKLEREGPP